MFRYNSFLLMAAFSILALGLTTGGCPPPPDQCFGNPCDDGFACNGLETCVSDGLQAVCSNGAPVQCLEREICLEPLGDCAPGGDPLPCDDGEFCNGAEFRNANSICVSDGDPCGANEVCNEDLDLCECASDAACDDADACTADSCLDGQCVIDAVICDIGWSCDPTTGNCELDPGSGCALVVCGPGETCIDGGCVPVDPCYVPGQGVTRRISINPPGDTLVYGVEDTPPTGWTVSGITHDGEYDAGNNAVKWFFLDDATRTLTYTATPPNGTTGTKCFSGIVNFDGGANQNIAQECFPECQ